MTSNDTMYLQNLCFEARKLSGQAHIFSPAQYEFSTVCFRRGLGMNRALDAIASAKKKQEYVQGYETKIIVLWSVYFVQATKRERCPQPLKRSTSLMKMTEQILQFWQTGHYLEGLHEIIRFLCSCFALIKLCI